MNSSKFNKNKRQAKSIQAAKKHYTAEKAFQPCILKTNIQSKLLNCPHYNPPRHRNLNKNSPLTHSTLELEKSEENEEKLRSASRSEELISTIYDNNEDDDKLKYEEDFDDEEDEDEKCENTKSILKTNTSDYFSSLKKAKEDYLYIKFIYEITQDIIRDKLFTDKQVEDIIQCHIQRNDHLNKKKLFEEVENFKKDLKIDKYNIEIKKMNV